MKKESVALKTVRTSFWSGIEKVFGLGIQFVISILLARFLSPDDYGTIAMLTVFIAISNQVVSCGFVNALIRKIECKSIDYSTAFYFNIFVSLLCYIIIYFAAPYVALFYKMDILCGVLRACGLSIPLGALIIVQDAILRRNLQMKKLTFVSISTSSASGLVSVWLAYSGFGVWALVFHQLFSCILRVMLLWYKTSWLPKWEYSKDSMRYLWNFGSKMLVTEIISSTYANIYSIVIGKAYNSNTLGVFNRGQSIAILLPNVLEGIFVRNSLPIMAQLQDNKEQLIHVYIEFIKLTCFLTFPIVFLMVILAEPFVLFVLTDRWIGCVIYIQIFSINALLSPANSVNLNLLQVFGRSDYTLKAETIKKSLGFLMVFLLIPYGAIVLAAGSSLFGIFCNFVNLYYAKKLSGLTYWFQIKVMIPVFMCSILMSVFVLISIHNVESNIMKLIIGALVGMGSYFVLTNYIFKVDTMKKLLNFKKVI